jgi:hypothetical protein
MKNYLERKEHVDLGKIPEGSTHYLPETKDSIFAWIRLPKGSTSMEMYMGEKEGVAVWQKFVPFLDEDEDFVIMEIPKVRYVEITMELV